MIVMADRPERMAEIFTTCRKVARIWYQYSMPYEHEEVGLGARLRSASFGKHGGSFLVSAEASIDAQSEAPEIAVVNAPYRATSPQPGF